MSTIHDRATEVGAAPVRSGTGSRMAWGGSLLFLGVALEWVLDPQRGDGTVLDPTRFAVCVGTSVIGAALLVWALRDLRTSVPRTRPARIGRATSTVGAVLLLVSMAAILATGLVSGTPAGIAFLPWGLGMLALSVGPVVLGSSLLRRGPVVGGCLVVAGLAALGSIVIPVDPWHDVSLALMCAAWVGAGLAVRS